MVTLEQKIKKILLLIDNALLHFDPHYLSTEQDKDNVNEETSEFLYKNLI